MRAKPRKDNFRAYRMSHWVWQLLAHHELSNEGKSKLSKYQSFIICFVLIFLEAFGKDGHSLFTFLSRSECNLSPSSKAVG
jgi:hypothetical protein